MCASAIDKSRERAAIKTALRYLIVSVVCVLIGAVYELFSHEVYSYFMMYAFIFPLAGGALPFLMLSVCRSKRFPRLLSRRLYHSGIAALTVGSFVEGILKIYGTTNRLTAAYWIFGIVFVCAGILSYVPLKSISKKLN